MEHKLEITYLILVVIIFLLITTYLIISYYKKQIIDNWVEYRCNPLVIPFASLFKQDTGKNFKHCTWNTMKKFFAYLLKPVLYIYKLIFSSIKNMSKTLNNARKYIFSIRMFIVKYIQNLMARIENFSLTLRKTLIKINDLLKKHPGIVQVGKYIMIIDVYFLTV